MMANNTQAIWGDGVGSDITLARSYLVPGPVLDLGSGIGAEGLWVAQSLSSSLHSVDIDPNALNALRESAPPSLELQTTVADLESLKIDKDGYSTIICSMVLQFLSPAGLRSICSEMLHGVRQCGSIIFSVFSLEDGSLPKLRSRSDCREVAPAHFLNEAGGYFHFFSKEELLSLFPGFQLRMIRHSYFEDLFHGDPHYHGIWFVVITKSRDK